MLLQAWVPAIYYRSLIPTGVSTCCRKLEYIMSGYCQTDVKQVFSAKMHTMFFMRELADILVSSELSSDLWGSCSGDCTIVVVVFLPRSRGKVMFSIMCVCLSVCLFTGVPVEVPSPGAPSVQEPISLICSNLFNLDLAVQGHALLSGVEHFQISSLWSRDYRRTGGWHLTEMPSCSKSWGWE